MSEWAQHFDSIAEIEDQLIEAFDTMARLPAYDLKPRVKLITTLHYEKSNVENWFAYNSPDREDERSLPIPPEPDAISRLDHVLDEWLPIVTTTGQDAWILVWKRAGGSTWKRLLRQQWNLNGTRKRYRRTRLFHHYERALQAILDNLKEKHLTN